MSPINALKVAILLMTNDKLLYCVIINFVYCFIVKISKYIVIGGR